MIEPALIGAISGVVGATVAVLTLHYARRSARATLHDRITKAENESTLAKSDVSALTLKVAALGGEVTMTSRDVNDYRVEQAEKMARLKTMVEVQVTSLSAAENRMGAAVENMGTRFDNMSTRLDTFHQTIIDHLVQSR